MPSYVIRPSAIGSYDAWALSAGGSKPAAVDPGDPVSHDDLTSYLTSAGASSQAFTMLGVPPDGVVLNSYAIHDRVRDPGGVPDALCQRFVRVAGADGTTYNFNPGGSFANASTNNPTKSGAVALAIEDLVNSSTNFQHGITFSSGSTDVNVTSMWGVADITPAPGGYIDLIYTLLGLISSGALTIDQIPGLARAVFIRSGRRVRILRREYADVLRELREYRYPRHFMLRVA